VYELTKWINEVKSFSQTCSPSGYPTYPPAFYGTSNFVSAFKRIRNFRSLPTHVCTLKKPGFRLGSFTLPHFSVVWFDSVPGCGVDKIFHQKESKEPRAGRILCWLEATHSSSITAGWCCWVHTSSHRVPANSSFTDRSLSLIQNLSGSVTSNEVNKNWYFIIGNILIWWGLLVSGFNFRTRSTFIEIWSSVHCVLFWCFQLCAFFCSQMHIIYKIHIFITYYHLHVTVFVTPSSGRPLLYLLKNCMLFVMLLHRLCYKI
jgi:hypothetical protein